MSDSYLTCGVCDEKYNESKNIPLVLVCGHTFCSPCIARLHSFKVRCPLCNKDDPRAIKDIPRNYIISEVVFNISQSTFQPQDWACKFHPKEQISYFCKLKKVFLCDECLHSSEINHVIKIQPKEVLEKIYQFRNLFEITTPYELKERVKVFDLLSEGLEGYKMKILQDLEDGYKISLQDIENQFLYFKQRAKLAIEKEQEKVQGLKEVMNLLSEMKTIGIQLDQVDSKLKENKMFSLIAALAMSKEIGYPGELKKILEKGLECDMKLEINKDLANLAYSVIETCQKLIKGAPEAVDLEEKKLSRFGVPMNRWGIFEARNQIEAVTFTVNKSLYITGIGIGNAYHPGKSVKLENFYLIEGGSTTSPVLIEGENIELEYTNGGPKVVKVPFDRPMRVIEGKDYTIKIIIRGGAGAFRGGTTTRVREGAAGVVFKFKNAVYGGDDIKNGENADDGPIFDIYYKTALDDQSFSTFSRFDALNEDEKLEEDSYSLCFSFNRRVSLTGLNLACPFKESSELNLNSLSISGPSKLNPDVIKSEVLINNLVIPYKPSQSKFQVSFSRSFNIEANTQYNLVIKCSCPSIYKAVGFKGDTITSNGIIFKTRKSGNFKDMSESGPIIDFFLTSSENLSNYSKILIPQKFLEKVSGETKIERFEGHEKYWHLNSDNQIECFSFSFSENVLISAFGLGNSSKINSFITMESLQILSGGSSSGQVIYNSIQKITLFNNSDENPVVKVRLESPVKLLANNVYTLKIVMRGEGKAFKGKKCLGSSIAGSNGVVFKCFKAKLSGSDKQNGDNESAGPIFDVYYIPLNNSINIDEYKKNLSQLYTSDNSSKVESKVITDEFKLSRYSSTGSSWHVNTDGKQIESISFKPSVNVNLTAVGIGNAHEEGKKVTVGKIQIKEGRSTKGTVKIYKHKKKEKMINVGEDSKFVRIQLENMVKLVAGNWYTLMVKYKPGVPVCRGTMANNQPSFNGVTFTFAKSKYEGSDVENGSHEVHGPLKDFYYTLN